MGRQPHRPGRLQPRRHQPAQGGQGVKKFNVPIMVLGGGGYTIRNVCRAWTYETAVCVDVDLPEQLPFNDYFQYFGPDYRLEVQATNMENMNSRDYLDRMQYHLFDLEPKYWSIYDMSTLRLVYRCIVHFCFT